jgi:hypothetical protein
MFYCESDKFKTFMENRKCSNNNNNNNIIRNDYYINNNYIYSDDFVTKQTKSDELPYWYDDEKYDDIVEEFVDEWNIFYDTTISVENEIKMNDKDNLVDVCLTDYSDESGDDEWSTV